MRNIGGISGLAEELFISQEHCSMELEELIATLLCEVLVRDGNQIIKGQMVLIY